MNRARAWRQAVLDNEGLSGWKIVEGEPYCWIDSESIMVHPDSDEVTFLHEVAHALHPHTEGPLNNHYHGGNWASAFGWLIRKYMEVRK